MLGRLLLSSALAVSCLAALSGCGDSFERVEQGEASCLNQCRADFGSINFNRQGQRASSTIQNIGDGDLQIVSVRLEDTSPYVRFTSATATLFVTQANWTEQDETRAFETNGGTLNVPPNERIDIELEFSGADDRADCPAGGAVGTCGRVIVETNDRREEGRIIEIPIGLDVGEAAIEVEPRQLSFSPPQLTDEQGERYAEQRLEFVVTNTGITNLTIQSIDPSDDFLTVDLPNGGLSLPYIIVPNDQRAFSAIWQPQSDAPLDATIVIRSDAINEQLTALAVDSDGTDASAIVVDPCDFNFGEGEVGTPSAQQFTVENTGTATMTWSLSLLNFSPPDARSEFRILNADGLESLGNQEPVEPGASTEMVLEYTPSELRSVSGTMRFSGNFGQPRSCSFAAGPAVPDIVVSPSNMYASGVDEGDTIVRSFVVSNEGRALLNVESIDLGGGIIDEFEVDALDLTGFGLDAGEARRIDITFNRNADDTLVEDRVDLVINHNDVTENGGTSTVRFFVNHDADRTPPECSVALSAEGPYATGDTVTLDPSATTFGSGEPSSNAFRWNLVAPTGSGVSIGDEFGETLDLTFDVPGTYNVGVVATAVYGESERSQCEQVFELVVN